MGHSLLFDVDEVKGMAQMGAAVGHSLRLMLMKPQWTFSCVRKLVSCLGSFKRFRLSRRG